MKYISGFFIGVLLTIVLNNYAVFYKLNCDTTRFGGHWINRAQFDERPFQCLDTNVLIQKETNLYMWAQLMRNSFYAYFY